MPDINISSIVLSKFSVTIGDEVISEVCMTNNGSRGDIELYTGFAYKDNYGVICYIGDGYGNGYLNQIIGDVLAGEYLCPYDLISVTQEVIDAKKSGKDVKFWASAIPGNNLGKSVIIEIPQEPIFCTQYFRIEDQHRNPLKGVITSPSRDIDLQVPNTGEISLYMEKGITHVVTAHNYEYNLEQTLSFTTCTSQPLIFVLDIPEPCRQYFKVVDSDNNPVTDVTISISDEFALSVNENGELSYNLIKDKVYDIEIIQHHDPVGILIYSDTFTCCAINPLVIEIELLVSDKGKIGTITHRAYEHVGEDEIDFEIPVTNISGESKYFYIDLKDENGNILDRAPWSCESIPAGETEIIYMSSAGNFLDPWSFEDVKGQTVTFELILSNSICAHVEVIETVTHEIEEDIPVPPEFGKMGTITYEMIKQVGNDEITFYIPVTNHTDEEQCFYVNLMNPDDETEVLEKAPNMPIIGRIADRIPAGDTEIIELSSTWDLRWNINNVLGKIVKFELRHSEPILDVLGVVVCNPLKSAYDVVHEVSTDLTNIDIMVDICVDNTEGLVTKDLQIGLMYCDPTHLSKTDVCGSPVDVINITSNIICTSYPRPGPFTCSGTAYLADSKFVAYARGFDDENNEYVLTSPVFRSIYGIKHITVKITGEPLEECFIDHPFDPTKCLITEDQWTFVKWTGIGIAGLYVFTTVAPLIKSAGKMLEKSQD